MKVVSIEEFDKNSDRFAEQYKYAGFFNNDGSKVVLFKSENNSFGKTGNKFTNPSSYQKSVAYKNLNSKGRSWLVISTYMGGK